jgi:phosphatidylglycerol:prolipoprotein diacylglycerol transferase
MWIHPRKRYDGQVFAAFLALYAVARFLLEYLRRDDRGGFLGLSTSQLMGLGMLAAAAVIHYVRASSRRAPPQQLASPQP